MSVRGVLLGALGLALLQMVVSDPARADRLGTLGTVLSGAIARYLSPAIAAIPDLRSGATSPPAATTTTSSGTAPAPSDVQIANSTYPSRLPPRGSTVAS